MCGIVGTLSYRSSSEAVSPELLARMRDAMEHRGPDGAGLWLSDDRRVGLGHRRLSIIDLSTEADQPMATRDGRLHLVFNGEIYNHAELRKELEATGRYTWQTDHSDTEVLLHAWAEWGVGCVERFRGMFAFAMWDAHQRRLWLVRDRIGIKPLYYCDHGGRLSFASEIKALLVDPSLPRRVDEEALFHYMSFITTPAPRTLFAGIRKLPAGTWLCIEPDGQVRERLWWDVLDRTTPLPEASEEELAERILSTLREAVELRKVGDVPVGVFLSGGIDSSTNAALFSQGSGGGVKTFSIGYQGHTPSYQNELHHARLLADLVHADHHERLLDEDDLLRFVPRMIWLQDEPIGDPVCMPVYYVAELARQHGVVVCQVGEGADELFWGYPTWKVKLGLERANRWPVPHTLKRLGLQALRWSGHEQGHHYEALRRAVAGEPVFWGGVDAITQQRKQRLLSPRLRRQLDGLTSFDAIRPLYQRFLDQSWERTPLSWMTYVDLKVRLPELLLMRVDKMTMGVSLEARVPFLDHRLVELAMSIPEAVKTRDGTLKHILKKAVRGVIPDSIIDRPKQGFGVPVADWHEGRLGEQMRQEVRAFARATDYLDPQGVELLTGPHEAPRLWYLYNFVQWHRHFIEGVALPSSALATPRFAPPPRPVST